MFAGWRLLVYFNVLFIAVFVIAVALIAVVVIAVAFIAFWKAWHRSGKFHLPMSKRWTLTLSP